jgi:hypothetical protein
MIHMDLVAVLPDVRYRQRVQKRLTEGASDRDEKWNSVRSFGRIGVLQNHRPAVRKIIFTQRVEDIQNATYGDGLPKVPSV